MNIRSNPRFRLVPPPLRSAGGLTLTKVNTRVAVGLLSTSWLLLTPQVPEAFVPLGSRFIFWSF